MLIIEIEKRHNKMVDRIRWDTVSYLPFYYVFFQFLLLTIFNLQANILTTKDILSNRGGGGGGWCCILFVCIESLSFYNFKVMSTMSPCVLKHFYSLDCYSGIYCDFFNKYRSLQFRCANKWYTFDDSFLKQSPFICC